jgi:sulfite exporter TauE/SafE
VSSEIDFGIAFATGLLGAGHCIGMCSGLAGGLFIGCPVRIGQVLAYHGARVLAYTAVGVVGASLGHVIVQTGAFGKAQGVLMTVAGALIAGLGLWMLWQRWQVGAGSKQTLRPCLRQPSRWPPVVAGTLNGLVPCSLVFSVALKATATLDPARAGLLMLVFGIGTLPSMLSVSLLGRAVGLRARGAMAVLAAFLVVILGLWTLYEGAVFLDVMWGLSN